MIKPLFYRKKTLYFGDKTFISETKTFKKNLFFLKIRVEGLDMASPGHSEQMMCDITLGNSMVTDDINRAVEGNYFVTE